MQSSEFALKSLDGLSLFARIWESGDDSLGAICLVHGLGEHSGRYGDLAASLNANGWAVLAMDMRGHGMSGGRRGHITSYGALMDDISILLAEAGGRFPDLPRFLCGQSMGGNLVINYALRRTSAIAGVIASSPLLRTAAPPPCWKSWLGRFLRPVLPLLPLCNEIRAEDLSRDLDVVRAYRIDPLVHDRLTLRFYDVLLAGEWAIRQASDLSVPTLIMHGDSDRVTSIGASREFSSAAGDICTLKEWEGFYHEIHNEPGREQVIEYLLEWLELRATVLS
jgi:alpha-beta hydrolase superfamily lysophospholipase